ncbi:MAG: glycosyltransferase family 4 protein [Gammaproteobacteria bacterium]|nr:glycosyltransferase family 4 protein [Gammaproteobacteria bacterium]
MHIAIPFPTDTIRMSFGKPEFTWGRDVATHSFLSGLAEAGVSHRVTLWVPSRADAELLENTVLAEIQANIHIISGIEITRYLEEHPVDVMHVMDPNMWIGGHIRNLLTDRDFVITGMTHSLGNQHFLDWSLLSNANGIESSDCLICTTPTAQVVINSMFSHLKAHQPDYSAPQTEVIPLGMDLTLFQAPTRLTRQDLGLPADDFVILSLGRFNPISKMDVLPLLNLLSMLKQKSMHNVRLVLAGSENDGQYVQFLRDRTRKIGLEDSVSFITSPTDEQKVALYQLADVFLSLSDNLQETFGLTVIEALACGLPVVVSDWDGYRALVEHEVTGFLVSTKMLGPDPQWEANLSLQPDSMAHILCAQTTAVDLPAACEALLGLAGDREALQRMSGAAAASAAQYDWQQIIPRYLALWEQLVERKAAAGINASERNRRTSALRFLQDFSGYPSTQLLPDDQFVTSEIGQLLLQGKATVHPYEETQEILDLQLMAKILNTCLHKTSVQELLSIIQPAGTGQDALRISQNLLWLYKYGYLSAQ